MVGQGPDLGEDTYAADVRAAVLVLRGDEVHDAHILLPAVVVGLAVLLHDRLGRQGLPGLRVLVEHLEQVLAGDHNVAEAARVVQAVDIQQGCLLLWRERARSKKGLRRPFPPPARCGNQPVAPLASSWSSRDKGPPIE
jgi:hypothetical protein